MKNENQKNTIAPSPEVAAPAALRPPSRGATGDAGPREIDLRDVMGGAREIVLVHNGEQYRLRITARGKLILTK